jgi:mannose-6-phosphate isomerase
MERIDPRFVEKPDWGATRLAPWFEDRAAKTGEVWFARPGDPLLIKFLFTTAKLSVQVHPGDIYAARHHGSRGKTEMWHVLAAEPGAQIAAGFREPVTAARLRELALSGEIEQLLAWHDARPGDTFFLPAGTVHAIGAGLTLVEIQQHSDVTYRLYDYGRPRELHIDHAIAVAHRDAYNPRRTAASGVLAECTYFRTEKLHIAGRTSLGEPQQEQTLIFIEGQASLGGRAMPRGDVWRGTGPAGIEGQATLLRVVIPGVPQPE